jgi:two-component system chemotaxis sensor kinase CheA
MMDFDEELISLFKVESEERLQNLDQGLLRLEANAADPSVLEEVFREAHNLKGAARMLGAADLGTVAHRFEDILGNARRGVAPLSPEGIDRLCQSLDAMRKLVHSVVTGEPCAVDVEAVVARLNGEEAPPPAPSGSASPVPEAGESGALPTQAAPGPEPPGTGEPDASPHAEALLPMLVEPPPPALAAASSPHPDHPDGGALAAEGPRAEDSRPDALPVPSFPAPVRSSEAEGAAPALAVEGSSAPSAFKIETIRVEPQKLDALMTHAGELTVTRSRFALRLAEIDELISLHEEWCRDAALSRSLLNQLSRQGGNGAAGQLASLDAAARERLDRLGALLDRLKSTVYEDVARLDFVADRLEEGIRSVRLLPLSTLFNLFPRTVRDLSREQSKEVRFTMEGGEIAADKRILEEMKDPLMHMIRNAIDHGIEAPEERARLGKPRTATLQVRASRTATNILIEIRDDGRGIDLEAVRQTALKRRVRREEELEAMSDDAVRALIFAPGFSTRAMVTDLSGRGVGLDVVRRNVELLKGSLAVDSSPGAGCRMLVRLPITLATTRVLILVAAGQTFALPVEYVQSARLVSSEELFAIRGCETTLVDGAPVSVSRLSRLLGLGEEAQQAERGARARAVKSWPCVFLALGHERLGVLVDALLDEQEIVLKPLGAMLARVPNISGATILGTGEVCMVLSAQDLLKTARRRSAPVLAAPGSAAMERKQVILLVEDSITTRTQEKRILEGAGYEVVTAVDGLDGFNKLNTRRFDAIVSDIEMPNMDGLTLAAKVRQDDAHRELPIILVTSLASDESRKKGIEAGASAYLTKSTFDQTVLLETLRRLV